MDFQKEAAMTDINYDDINFQELVTFLNVAQTGSMSLTAQMMHVSQPAVSKRIASLENRFGLILFARSKGSLKITPAGEELYHELVLSVEHLKAGLTRAREAQADPSSRLRFGYDGYFDLPLLHQIFSEFSEKCPQARIETTYPAGFSGEGCSPLFNKTVDIMLCPDDYASGVEGLVQRAHIADFKFHILVARSNPLAAKDDLGPADLLGVPLVVAHNSETSSYLKAIRSIFLPYGFAPTIGHKSSRESLCLDIVEKSGVGIATPEFWKRLNSRASSFFASEIRSYPIPDAVYPMSLVWRADAPKHVAMFAECFNEVISRSGNTRLIQQAYSSD